MTAPLAGRTIAITRPLGQATRLSSLVSAAGGDSLAFPLIAIAALEDYREFDATLEQLAACDWAIFISSNAVQNGMPRVRQRYSALPPTLQFAAIGPVTAAELAEYGVPQVLTPLERFDSEALLALPQMQAVAGQRVMIFRGVGGRDVLADTLRQRGASVVFAECYRRINPQHDLSPLTTRWQQGQLHAMVVTSSEAMRHLLDLAQGNEQQMQWLRSVAICVNHARIAEQPQSLGLNVHVAQTAGDEAMLQCLLDVLN